MLSKNKWGQTKGKRIVSAVLAFLMLALMVPVSAFAIDQESIIDEGGSEALPAWLTEASVGPQTDLLTALEALETDVSAFENYGAELSDDALQAEGIGEADILELEDSISGFDATDSIEPLDNGVSSELDTQALGSWKRMNGQTRYDTMASIVQETFPRGSTSKVAILATGETFPDALAASPLAGDLEAPIILTAKSTLTAQAENQINSLGIKHIIIIGSTQAVSADVEKKLVKKLGKDNVIRCYGSNRFETAYEIYKLGASEGLWGQVAFIATGNNFPDALSAGPIAFRTSSPIFLYNTASKSFDAKQLAALKSGQIKKVILLGSASVLPESIRNDLGTLGSAENCIRVSGSDRYLTSLAVAEFGIQTKVLGNGLTSEYAALATGTNFPDALCGAALCGRMGAPLYLVHDSPQGRVGMYRSLARSVYHNVFKQGYILGSDRAVAASILTKVKGLGSATSQEQQVIDLVNKERSKVGLPALKAAPILQGACDIRADEITSYFSHARPYRYLWYYTAFTDDLAGESVLAVSSMGENIAGGFSSPTAVMDGWMGSSGHKANLLNSKHKYIGVGHTVGPNGVHYWVQFFAS